MLAAAAPSVAKTWARDHGAPADVVAHPLHSPPRADGQPEPDPAGQQWLTSGLVDRISVAIAEQANDPEAQDLLTAGLTAVPFHSFGVNEVSKVELSTGGAAFHKPFTAGELNFGRSSRPGQMDPYLYEQALREVAAYRFSLVLGDPWAGLVPTCVLREHAGELGSLSREAPGGPVWTADAVDDSYLMAGGFFDALIGETDRHPENMLVHKGRLFLIDHGFAFSSQPFQAPNSRLLEWRHVKGKMALMSAELAAIDRVLDRDNMRVVTELIGPAAAAALRVRAAQMRFTRQLPTPLRFHP